MSMDLLSYLFWPNPGAVSYADPHPLIALALCGVFLLASLVLHCMRGRLVHNFARAALWFGLVGLLLVVARAEEIQYISMRFWWIVWGGSLLLYAVVQCRRARLLWYEVISSAVSPDLREKYLPHRKRSH